VESTEDVYHLLDILDRDSLAIAVNKSFNALLLEFWAEIGVPLNELAVYKAHWFLLLSDFGFEGSVLIEGHIPQRLDCLG
jgi:hypothetical protein